MNSRERILSAIAHREPERVPVDLGATPSSGISAIAYTRFKARLGITGGHTDVYDVVQQLAQPEEAVLARCRIDVVDVCFWGGGCDTRAVLNHGSPDEVKDDVRRRIEMLAPGGGFVFNTIHNILPDVPPENIEAMFEAVAEYGGAV